MKHDEAALFIGKSSVWLFHCAGSQQGATRRYSWVTNVDDTITALRKLIVHISQNLFVVPMPWENDREIIRLCNESMRTPRLTSPSWMLSVGSSLEYMYCQHNSICGVEVPTPSDEHEKNVWIPPK